MASQPNENRTNDVDTKEFSMIGADATAAFEPSGSPFPTPVEVSSENLDVAGRKSGLDEEDEIEDDDVDDDDLDEDEDDDLEDDEDEDDDLDDEDEDDDLEDDDEDEEDEDEDEEDEDEEDEDEDTVPARKKR